MIRIALGSLLPLVAAWLWLQFDVLLVAAFAALLLLVAQGTRWTGILDDWRVFRALGDWSYGIYLWHAPVHFALMALCSAVGLAVAKLPRNEALLLAFAAGGLVIALAGVTYSFFEVPTRRALPKLLGRLRPETQPGFP
jgi:peptidoglycan/LPS O-acetylase OafA/YrhL